jgi:type IV secretion system protein VirD4
MMDRHSKWLRLVITSAIRAVLRPREAGEPKVLFMLDEFFALGRLEIISTVWALVRGYGIQMMPVLQGLTQLKKLEPDLWETFIGMAGAVLNFAPTNDFETAEWLSRRAGDTTRMITSGIGSFSEAKTPLITPHRLFGLRPGFMLLALDGVSNIIPAYAPPYFDIQQCLLRARDNPYHRG